MFRQLVLLLSSIATTVSWFVFRKEDWSWILQVCLAFCIHSLIPPFLSGLFRNHVQHQHAEGFTPTELAHLHHPPLCPLLLRHLLRLHHPPLHVRQECHGGGSHGTQLRRAAADGEKFSRNFKNQISSARCCVSHTSPRPPAECATCKLTAYW